MILTLDIGNSNTVVVRYDSDAQPLKSIRVITYKENVYEAYTRLVSDFESVEAIIVSCVVPMIHESVLEALHDNFKVPIYTMASQNMIGFETALDNPLEIGADFIATSIATSHKYPLPAIVVDVGSATKLTLTHESKRFEGGIIMPGVGSSLKAMTSMIPHLPTVELKMPPTIIGKNTIHAIQSGMMHGLVAQLRELSTMIERESGQRCVRVLTGGYAVLIKDYLPEFEYEPLLVNDGLYHAYQRNMIKPTK